MSEQTKENSRKKLEVTPSARLRIGQLLCLLVVLISLLLMRLYIDQMPVVYLTGACAVAGLVGDAVLAIRRVLLEKRAKQAEGSGQK